MERGYEEHSAKSDHDEGMSGEEKKAEFIIRQLFSRIIQELTQHNGSSELRECLHQEASRCSILDECEAVQDGNVGFWTQINAAFGRLKSINQASKCLPNKNIQSKRIKIEHSNDDTRIDSFTQRQSPFDKERINPQEDYSSGEPDLAFRKSMRKTEFTETESQMFLESQSSKVSFKDISGYSVVKDAINESIVYPLIFPQLFEAFTGIVLLYGPPGTGKSMFAQATATEIAQYMGNCHFLSISLSSILCKWSGEAEKNISRIFKDARWKSPSLNEIDAIATERKSESEISSRTLISELLIQLTKLTQEDKVAVIAATNRPFDIDSAILRRFHKHIHVGLPDVRERRELIQAQFCASSDTHCVSNDEIQVIAMKSEGYSGSDIAKVCNEAKLIPVRELLKNFEKSGIHPCASERRPVSIEDLKSALNSVPSTSSYKKYFLKGDD